MKVFRILGIILISLFAIYVIVAVVAPAKLEIEKSTTIDASAQAVMANVVCLDKWPVWSAWQSMDPEMTNEYSEDPCGVGAWNYWDGPKSGKGTQTIEEINGNDSIRMNVIFVGIEGVNYANWKFEETDGPTIVTWNFKGSEFPFFLRPINLVMKGVLEKLYADGLASLKEVVEAAPTAKWPSYDIKEIELPEVQYLLVSGDVRPDDIGEFYDKNFGKIMGYMTENKVETTGHPTGLYNNWTDTLAKMSAAIPVASNVGGTDEIEFRKVEACKALQIDYYGSYEMTGDAHYAMDDFMTANGLEMAGDVREVYVTDPMNEPDTNKWLTQIIYPVSGAE